MEVLLIVRYSDDAERKRLEYLIEKHADRLNFSKPEGAVVIIRGDEERIRAFVEELLARLPPEEITLKQLGEVGFEIGEKRARLELRTKMSPQEIMGALGLIMARLHGVLLSSTGGKRVFKVRVRGGTAEVHVMITPLEDGGSRVLFIVESYGKTVLEKVVSHLEDELRLLGEVVGNGA